MYKLSIEATTLKEMKSNLKELNRRLQILEDDDPVIKSEEEKKEKEEEKNNKKEKSKEVKKEEEIIEPTRDLMSEATDLTKDLVKLKGTAEAIEILNKFKVKRVSELKDERLENYIEELKNVLSDLT